MHLLAVLAVSVTLAVPGRASSAPTIAADGTFVAVAWAARSTAGVTDIYAAVSRDGAQTFGAPVQLSDAGSAGWINGEQPPRVVLTGAGAGDPSITVIWPSKNDAGVRLVLVKSADGGRTFSAPASVPDSDGGKVRGWQNAAADAQGRVFAIWLDHRDLGDTIDAEKSKLYIGAVDGSVAPRAVTTGVCYCCKTALAIAHGTIYAAWRHVYPGNMRDIAFTSSRDGGKTFSPPVRVSEDHWMLAGCPDDGPSIAVDQQQRIHIAWPTVVKDETTGESTKTIFYATSTDGKAFTTRLRLPTETASFHPQVMLAGGGLPVIAWEENRPGGGRRVVAAFAPDYERIVVTGDARGTYPSLALVGRDTLAAWTSPQPEGSVIQIDVIHSR